MTKTYTPQVGHLVLAQGFHPSSGLEIMVGLVLKSTPEGILLLRMPSYSLFEIDAGNVDYTLIDDRSTLTNMMLELPTINLTTVLA